MEVVICDSYEDMSRRAANVFVAQIQEDPDTH